MCRVSPGNGVAFDGTTGMDTNTAPDWGRSSHWTAGGELALPPRESCSPALKKRWPQRSPQVWESWQGPKIAGSAPRLRWVVPVA